MNTIVMITPVQAVWIVLILIILAFRLVKAGNGLLLPLLGWLLRKLFRLLLLIGLLAAILYFLGGSHHAALYNHKKLNFNSI